MAVCQGVATTLVNKDYNIFSHDIISEQKYGTCCCLQKQNLFQPCKRAAWRWINKKLGITNLKLFSEKLLTAKITHWKGHSLKGLLPGTITLWKDNSLERSLPQTIIHWKDNSQERSFTIKITHRKDHLPERSLTGKVIQWKSHSLERSLAGMVNHRKGYSLERSLTHWKDHSLEDHSG